MKLVSHGGKCCGIKTLYGFSYTDYPLASVKKSLMKHTDGCEGSEGANFFFDEAPDETYLKRFERLVEYIKTKRPMGIVEAVLAMGPGYNKHSLDWFPILISHGFVLINQCKNSNSGNTVYVLHLNVGDKPPVGGYPIPTKLPVSAFDKNEALEEACDEIQEEENNMVDTYEDDDDDECGPNCTICYPR